jgi:hypothetical protein
MSVVSRVKPEPAVKLVVDGVPVRQTWTYMRSPGAVVVTEAAFAIVEPAPAALA